jgi:aminoglycoside 3-N-acetyltransferase
MRLDVNVTSQPLLSRMSDDISLTGEVFFRQLYWRSPLLRRAFSRLLAGKKNEIHFVPRQELKDFLREIGVKEGALVMAHTSVTHLRIMESGEDAARTTFATTAQRLVNDLLELVGSSGTLVMPTNPAYQTEDFQRTTAERRNVVLAYDPRRTPCGVGLANELFRRRRDVVRSLHPYNTLAACGPLADSLFENNLNEDEPLPHGVYSSYYRLCERNALIIGVGATLRKYMTLVHVGEDVRDAEWPIKNFFERRQYRIEIDGQEELHTVRQRRSEFGRLCSLRKVFLDLVREGILQRRMIAGFPLDWASAKDVFDYIMHKNRNSHYPYYGVKFMQWSS